MFFVSYFYKTCVTQCETWKTSQATNFIEDVSGMYSWSVFFIGQLKEQLKCKCNEHLIFHDKIPPKIVQNILFWLNMRLSSSRDSFAQLEYIFYISLLSCNSRNSLDKCATIVQLYYTLVMLYSLHSSAMEYSIH